MEISSVINHTPKLTLVLYHIVSPIHGVLTWIFHGCYEGGVREHVCKPDGKSYGASISTIPKAPSQVCHLGVQSSLATGWQPCSDKK